MDRNLLSLTDFYIIRGLYIPRGDMFPTNEVTGLAKKSSERHFLSCSRSMLALALRSAFQVAIAFSNSTELGGAEVMLGVFVGSSSSPSCAIMLARS